MLDIEIRKQISLYTREEITSSDLEGWLSEKTWDIDDEPVATRDLAYEALRLTSEAANGDWTDLELRERLGGLSRTYWFKQAPKTAYANSDTRVTRSGPLPGAAAGIQRVAEYA